jgi:hypothetical protein
VKDEAEEAEPEVIDVDDDSPLFRAMLVVTVVDVYKHKF